MYLLGAHGSAYWGRRWDRKLTLLGCDVRRRVETQEMESEWYSGQDDRGTDLFLLTNDELLLSLL